MQQNSKKLDARVQAEQALQVTYKVNADQCAVYFSTKRGCAKTMYLLQGMWGDEKAKSALLETELKQVKEEVVQERLCTVSMRQDRDRFMTAEAKYTERARVLEAANYENKQMIRDHAAHVVSRVDDICKQVDAAGVEQAVKRAVEEVAGGVVEQAVRRAVEEIGKSLQAFDAIVNKVWLWLFCSLLVSDFIEA